jgi:hypothetical protein
MSDLLLALGLTILLVLRILPYILMRVSPAMRRRFENRIARMQALLDVGGGTLMIIFISILIWQRAWLAALLLGVISIPSLRGFWTGLVVLAKTPPS